MTANLLPPIEYYHEFGYRCRRLKLSRDYINPIICLQTDTGRGINNSGGGMGERE